VSTFTIGEEVMFGDEGYVIASISDDKPARYRLLQSTKKGARFVWAGLKDIEEMHRYLDPVNDTAGL